VVSAIRTIVFDKVIVAVMAPPRRGRQSCIVAPRNVLRTPREGALHAVLIDRPGIDPPRVSTDALLCFYGFAIAIEKRAKRTPFPRP
jgi:hypothetical protein